jgi:hypothetical protein
MVSIQIFKMVKILTNFFMSIESGEGFANYLRIVFFLSMILISFTEFAINLYFALQFFIVARLFTDLFLDKQS